MGKNNINIVRNKKGSTLIWVLILMLVLGILITAGLAIAQAYSSRSITQHVQKQSYYTAYSVTKTMAEWLQGTEIVTTSEGGLSTNNATTERQKFIEQLKKGETITKNVSISNSDMGTCVTTFEMNDKGDVLISSKADYDGENSVVSVTLKNTSTKKTIPGEPAGPVEWPELPSIDLPDRDSLTKMTNNNWDKDSIGQYEVSGTRDLGPNASVTGYIYIPGGSSLSISTGQHSITIGNGNDVAMNIEGSFTPNSQNAVVNGNILINGGTATLKNNTLVNGDIFLINGGELILANESKVNGNIYILDDGYVKMENSSTIEKNVFIYTGGYLEANYANTLNGNIYVQDGGSLTLNGESTSVNGDIVVYPGKVQSKISCSSYISFSEESGIYFLGPIDDGYVMPDFSNFRPSQTEYPKLLHVKNEKYITDGIPSWYPEQIYCTGSKHILCRDKVPNLSGPGIEIGTGGNENDQIITTESWSIGPYTGRDIAK